MDTESTEKELSSVNLELVEKPDNIRLILKRAELLRRLGYLKGDKSYTKKALIDNNFVVQKSPEFSQSWLERGLTYYTLDMQDLAIADYNKSISLEPTARTYYNRGVSQWRKIEVRQWVGKDGRKKMEEAAQVVLSDYQNAIKIDPNLANSYYNRGVVYMRLGYFSDAIEDFSKVIELDRLNPDSYFNRAVCYENLGPRYSDLVNLMRAVADYTVTLEIKPDYLPALCNRAICYEFMSSKGRYGEKENVLLAINDYSEVLKYETQNDRVLLNRGWAYEAIRDIKSAIKDYTSFIKLSKDREMVKQIQAHLRNKGE